MAERKRKNARERRPAILDAFYATIRDEGLENASIAKVAGRAGIHPSLVIHYFGSKERMLMALVDRVMDTYDSLIRRLPDDTDPARRLARVLVTIWGPEWYTAVEFSVVYSFLAIARRNQDVAGRVDRLYRTFRRFVFRVIKDAAAAGAILTKDPEAATDGLLALSEGSHYFRHHFGTGEAAHRNAMLHAALQILDATQATRDLCRQQADAARKLSETEKSGGDVPCPNGPL